MSEAATPPGTSTQPGWVHASLDRYLDWFVEQVMTPRLSGVDDHRRAKLLVVTCHAAGVLILMSIALRTLMHQVPGTDWLVVAGGASLVMLASPFLMRWASSVRWAAAPPILALSLAIPILTADAGGLDAPIITMVPAMPLVMAYFVGPSGAVGIAVLMAVETAGIAVASQRGWIHPHHTSPLVKATLIAAFLMVTAFIAQVYDRERQRFERRLHELSDKLHEVSIRDPLTGIYNRRHFSERLTSELAYSRRHGTPISVVMMDVDHFKRVNDVHGHRAGDAVLIDVAQLVQGEVRQEDLLARYGGEEFVLVLRDTDAACAKIVAERLRARVEKHEATHAGRTIRVTLSLGCAAELGGGTEETLLRTADARMYEAKRRGRNCVVGEGFEPRREAASSSPPAAVEEGPRRALAGPRRVDLRPVSR